ncbi:uncharacterized protein G2W53_000740 [Senna tora]|uniref:DUF4216 domain-containing protein n=1 Tax=Senna tora TaxID=362788 RepID=A0A834XEA2_9FABA|nr:uncharacterized protein G2W53_000740 [Senna tora]
MSLSLNSVSLMHHNVDIGWLVSERVGAKVVECVCVITRIKEDNYGLICVNFNKLQYQDDPFVLASQVHQCFYVQDPFNESKHYAMSKVSKDLLDGKEIENSDIQSFYWNQSNDHTKNLLGLVNDEDVQWIRQDLPETIVDQPIPMELFPISEVGGSTLNTHRVFVVEYGKDKDVVLGKSVAVYKDRKSQGLVPPRKLVINEGGEKRRSRDRSPEVSSPAVKKVKTGSSAKDMLVDLAQTLPSPPSVVPPSAEKEIPLLSYDLAVDARVGERSMAPIYPELDDYLVYKSDRSLYRSEYDAASLIRNRMSCSDDRSALEKLVRGHGPWALRDLLGKEMLRMCSTYAAFVETEEKMVGWYKDRLEEVSDAHQECLVLTRKLGECEKAVSDLTSERDRLKLEKETAVANMEVLRTKMSGFELEANNLKEQNRCMSERNDKFLEENLKLSEDLSMATSARDKLAADAKGYLDLLSQNQREIDDLRRALEVAREDHKSAVLGAKESIGWAWNNCLDQVKLLNPSLPIVFDGMDVYLSVVDGKLVSATSPEEEGADKEDEGKEVIDVEKIGPSSEMSLNLAHLFEEAAKDPSVTGSFPSDEPPSSKASPGDPVAVGAEPSLPSDPSDFPLAVVNAPSTEEGPRSVGDDYFHGYDAAF